MMKGTYPNSSGYFIPRSLYNTSARSRRRREQRRRRNERAFQQMQRKDGGRHRPDCQCATCVSELIGPACWSCGASRRPPPPRNGYPPGPPPVIIGPNGYPRPHPPHPRREQRRRGSRNNVAMVEEPIVEERMSREDLRTWSLAYTLSIDVYVCAERYCLQDFKACIAAFIINRYAISIVEFISAPSKTL